MASAEPTILDSLFAVGTPPSLNALFVGAALADVAVFAYATSVFHAVLRIQDATPFHIKRIVLDVWSALFVHLTYLLFVVDAFQIKSGAPDPSDVRDFYPATAAAGLLSTAASYHLIKAPLELWLHLFTLAKGDLFRSSCSPCDSINVTKALLNVWSLVLFALAVLGASLLADSFPNDISTVDNFYAIIHGVGALGIGATMIFTAWHARRASRPESTIAWRMQRYTQTLIAPSAIIYGELVLWGGWAILSSMNFDPDGAIILSSSSLNTSDEVIYAVTALQVVFSVGTALRAPVAYYVLLLYIKNACAIHNDLNNGTIGAPVFSNDHEHDHDDRDVATRGTAGVALPDYSSTEDSYTTYSSF